MLLGVCSVVSFFFFFVRLKIDESIRVEPSIHVPAAGVVACAVVGVGPLQMCAWLAKDVAFGLDLSLQLLGHKEIIDSVQRAGNKKVFDYFRLVRHLERVRTRQLVWAGPSKSN